MKITQLKRFDDDGASCGAKLEESANAWLIEKSKEEGFRVIAMTATKDAVVILYESNIPQKN